MIAPTQSLSNSRADASAIRGLKRVFQRNRWLILAAPVITVLAAVAFVRLTVPVYEGTTTIRLDKERSNLAVLDKLQELATGSDIQTEKQDLQSRSLAESVVAALDLNAELVAPKRVTRSSIFSHVDVDREAPETEYQFRRVSDRVFEVSAGTQKVQATIGETARLGGLEFALAPAAAQHENLELLVRPFPIAVRRFTRTLKVSRPDREASILAVRYEGTDKQLVTAIPNEVAHRFIERRDSVRKTQARSTVEFLAEQIDTLNLQLRAAEVGLLAYRERDRVISPQVEGETQVTQLAAMQAERDQMESERQSLAKLMAEIEAGPGGRDPASFRRLLGVPVLLRNPAASELLSSLNTLENQRTELLLRYKEADPDVITITQRIRQVDVQLREMIGTYLTTLTNQIQSIDTVLGRFQGQLATIPAKEIQLARLLRNFKVSEEIYTELQTRLKASQIAAAVQDPTVRILDPAIVPWKPIRPNVPLSLALAVMLGLALGCGVAFAREQLDNTIRNRDELQEASGAIPVLGLVPRIVALGGSERRSASRIFAMSRNGASTNGGDSARVNARDEARGPVAEAFRSLRTNIAFTQPDTPAKILVITSALPGEGKSTSACNLAITLAQQGLRVALIDADMRRASLHRSLHTPLEPGLSNVLAGKVAAADAFVNLEAGDTRLHFMPAGTPPPNPAELLASSRVQQMLNDLRPEFDAVVIDSPPLNVVTDGAIIGSRADGVLLVARAGITDRDAYRVAIEQLQSVRARVLGCVLNDAGAHAGGYYGRGTEYYRATPLPT